MTTNDLRRLAVAVSCITLTPAAARGIAAQPTTPQPVTQPVTTDSLAPARDTTDTLRAAAVPDSVPEEWLRFAAPGSTDEVYLRYLQVAGLARRHPWSVRSFSARDLRALAVREGTHPWSASHRFTTSARGLTLIPLAGDLRYNASLPYGSNDGAVWAGKGATLSISAGATLRAGPLVLALAPVAFVSQNAPFTLMDNGLDDRLRFADGMQPLAVDRPQRFGDAAYARVDPGNSSLQLFAGPFAIGGGTGIQTWGPLDLYPFVLGATAPGFLHAFAGSARPLDLRIFRVHGRVIWGLLEQSDWSPVTGSSRYVSNEEPGTRRFASGLVATVEPAGLTGLELGLARFIHSHLPRSGVPAGYFRKPVQGLFKSGLARSGSAEGEGLDNQLISVFARWAFPQARLELYTEYGRDDHSWDLRDFAQEPDHARSYGLGARWVAHASAARLDGLTLELINFQLPTLARTGRGEGLIYLHRVIRQGHTHRGQLLGADVGVDAAAGLTLRWDRYVSSGRRAVAIHRNVRQQRGTFYLDGRRDVNAIDVQYALEGERSWHTAVGELSAGLALIRGLNRDFQRDVWNASLQLGFRRPLDSR